MGLIGDILSSIELNRIQRENSNNQGITRYKPSQIEAFFDYSAPIENMAFSGGATVLRARSIARVIDIANSNHFFTLILHCGDTELERFLKGSNMGYGMCFVNPSNPIYDPFWGKDKKEISRMVYDSATRNYRLRADSKYYIEGIYEYLKCRKVTPCLYMYSTCPHMELLSKIGDAEKKKVISTEQASRITSLLIQGKSQLPDIENFFSALEHQGGSIFASANKVNKHEAVNMEIASKNSKALMLDILMDNNDILLNVIMNEVEYMISRGKRVLLILDGVSPVASEMMKNYLNRNDSKCSMILSGEDVFSMFVGEERSFYSFLGKCSKVVISNHASAYSCDKWSDYIGTYEKQDISYSSSSNTNGWGSSTSYRTKRDRIVKPEEIRGMGGMDVCIKDKFTGEIAITTVI